MFLMIIIFILYSLSIGINISMAPKYINNIKDDDGRGITYLITFVLSPLTAPAFLISEVIKKIQNAGEIKRAEEKLRYLEVQKELKLLEKELRKG